MKPGVFSQVYVQLVFSPKSKETLFRSRSQREEVWKYISGVVTNKNHKSIIINGTKDHVHIFLGLNPAMAISSLVADIKRSSSIFINEKKWFPGKFNWQEGYGVFSYSRSQIDNVYNYILNQEEHHKTNTFKEEYLDFLKKFQIEYDERFLFEFFD